MIWKTDLENVDIFKSWTTCLRGLVQSAESYICAYAFEISKNYKIICFSPSCRALRNTFGFLVRI